MRGVCLVGGTCLLLLCWTVGVAPQGRDGEIPPEALDAMHGFLGAWLVQEDKTEAVTHFSATYRSQQVAPRAVRAVRDDSGELSRAQVDAYWHVLQRLGGAQNGDRLHEILAPLDPDLMAILRRVVRMANTEQLFTVFVAEDDVAIDSFDGGYGDVAAALQPAENLVLTMIADFADRGREAYSGPFVSFWSKEHGAWRIQALGAVPNEEAWLDGQDSTR